MNNIPGNLYQYFSFEDGFEFLKTLKLTLSPLDSFNDPFEFLPVSKYVEVLISKSKVAMLELINILEKRKQEIKEPPLIFYLSPLSLILSYHRANKKNNLDAQIKSIRAYLDCSDNIRLSCFSENCNNILMWGHYGRKHTGMVIAFKTNMEYWGDSNFFKVMYSNNRITVPQEDDSTLHTPIGAQWQHDLYCTKSLCWSYENEWRYIKYQKHCQKENRNGNDFYYVPIVDDTVSAIYLGCRTSSTDREQITKYCKQHLPNVPIFKACPDNNSYALTFETI
jgi:hypothetical protein